MAARRIVITYDVSAITAPDEAALDALARLQLLARRVGATVRLENAQPELVGLLRCVGLADVLGVEVDGQVEQREESRVDEEVDAGDPTL